MEQRFCFKYIYSNSTVKQRSQRNHSLTMKLFSNVINILKDDDADKLNTAKADFDKKSQTLRLEESWKAWKVKWHCSGESLPISTPWCGRSSAKLSTGSYKKIDARMAENIWSAKIYLPFMPSLPKRMNEPLLIFHSPPQYYRYHQQYRDALANTGHSPKSDWGKG